MSDPYHVMDKQRCKEFYSVLEISLKRTIQALGAQIRPLLRLLFCRPDETVHILKWLHSSEQNLFIHFESQTWKTLQIVRYLTSIGNESFCCQLSVVRRFAVNDFASFIVRKSGDLNYMIISEKCKKMRGMIGILVKRTWLAFSVLEVICQRGGAIPGWKW